MNFILENDLTEYMCDLEEVDCPYPCTCEKNIVDCKEKFLTEIPKNFPVSTVEL